MKQFKFTFLVVALMMILSNVGWGQVSITNSSAVTEAFTGFTGAASPTNWTVQGTGTGGIAWRGTTQTTGTSGGWYGNSNMSFLGSGTATNGNGTWLLQNNTGSTITGFTISFMARLWKSGSASPTVSVSWSNSSSNTNPVQGALTNVLSSLTFNDATPNISTTGATLSQTVSSLSIANGQYIFIRFIHPGGSNSDNLGWDDISFTPTLSAPANTITTGIVTPNSGTTFDVDCISGEAGTVAFTSTGSFTSNTYTAQLSNSVGSFASPTNIGTLVSDANSGTINVSVLAGTTNGSGYLIQVVSSSPVVTGSSSSAFTVNNTCSAPFRSKTSGNWNSASTWQYSIDNGSNWIDAPNAPSSTDNTITILNGHTVTITTNVTADQVVINSGGIIDNNAGTLTINDGTGDDFTIENGGIYKVTNTNTFATAITFTGSSTILVKTGGKIQIGSGGVVGSSNNGYATSASNVIWENSSIFEWNCTPAIFGASGVTFFPNVSATTIPIFRITIIGGNPGGGGATVINGITEINTAFTWNGAGTKTFRNGIRGTADMTQSTNGQWIISGTTAELGGTGALSLGTNGLIINSGTSVTLSSNKTINTGTITINGILDCSNYVISGTGALTLSSGATMKTANVTGITGAINVSGTKTFNAGANYEFNGSGTQVSGALMPTTVNNLTINNSAGVSLSNDVTVNGILTLSTGALTIGNYILNLNGTVANSGTGTLTGSVNSVLQITGTGDLGTLNFTSGARELLWLIMDRTLSGKVAFGTDLNVDNELDLTNGFINMGANTLTLGTGLATTGTLTPVNPTSASYIIGNFERWIPNTTFADMYFPVGTSGQYRPAIISYTTASSGGKLNVSGYETDPGSINTDTSITETGTNYVIDRYSKEAWWKFLTSDITGGVYDISFEANAIVGVSATNFDRLRILKRANNSSLWTLVGDHSAATGSNIHPLVKRIGLTGFSEFGIGGNSADGNVLNDAPLPVTLSSLNSSIIGRNIKLNWTTASEINNSGFNVERAEVRSQNLEFSKIGFIQGKGTVNTPTNYSFEDRNLQTGKYKYRLKQIDVNGNFEYFALNGEVEIGVPKTFNLSQNYPNPFNPVTKINFDLPENGKVDLRLYDMLGREIATLVNEVRTAGYYTVNFDASKLSSGIYFYRMNTSKFSSVKKMAVIK